MNLNLLAPLPRHRQAPVALLVPLPRLVRVPAALLAHQPRRARARLPAHREAHQRQQVLLNLNRLAPVSHDPLRHLRVPLPVRLSRHRLLLARREVLARPLAPQNHQAHLSARQPRYLLAPVPHLARQYHSHNHEY